MAHIISVSLPPELVAEAGKLEKSMGFRNRSELFRASLESLKGEHEAVEALRGNVTAVLSVMHQETWESRVVGLRHGFHDVILTSMHHEFKNACVELFLLEGPAERVKEMYREYRRHRGTQYVRLMVQP